MNVYQFAKSGLLPGTLGLLLLIQVSATAALWFPRRARVARWVLALVTGFYIVLSVPAGAWLLTRFVARGYEPIGDRGTLARIQAIVVLDGGEFRYERAPLAMATLSLASAERAVEAARLYRLMPVGRVVISGGAYDPAGVVPEGAAIRDALVTSGIPADRIELDTTSRNTGEHAANVPALLHRQGITNFALVTSAVHMRRAMRAFTAAGEHPVPAPAPAGALSSPVWWPSTRSLERSYEALYEMFGILLRR